MRVALVGPELEENLALRYIHAAAVSGGHDAEIFDFHEPAQIPELVCQVLLYRPDVVGLSMVFTARAREYAQLAAALREAGFTGHIAAGGHFASFHAQQLLEDVPAIDTVLHGEGERAILDLLEHLPSLSEVAGLSFRDAGRVRTTAPRRALDDIDQLPPPTRSQTFHTYFGLPIANVLSGRGCFANCDFCSINAWHRKIGGKRFRQRSVSNLVAEMARLYHERGVRIYNFHDDNFFLPTPQRNVERFSSIRDELRRQGVGRIGIQIKARPDSIEPQSLAILKEIGLFRVFLGVESNSVNGLKALGRGINTDQNRRALDLIKSAGIHVTFNLLMFEPQCTIDDLRDNIRFIAEQADVPLNFCRTEVYSGTALERRLREQGRLEGTYWGYGYTIADAAAQQAYEIFRQVFTPRNFVLGGANLRGMTVDYYYHILRHFHPAAAGADLHHRSSQFIRDLNASNVDLLSRICDFAQQADGHGAAEFTAELCAQRAEFDRTLAQRCDALLADMRSRAAAREAGAARLGRASAAAAAILVSVLGCRDTHVSEMAPPDRTTRPADPPDRGGTTRPEIPTHPAEMVPRDINFEEDGTEPFEMVAPDITTRPASLPTTTTSQPTTRPDQPPPLPPDVSGEVQLQAMRRGFEQFDLAKRHDMVGKQVVVDLVLDDAGRVVKHKIIMPPDEKPDFQRELGQVIQKWQFKQVKQAGTVSVRLRFMDRADTHIFEMAPKPL